ncbi:MAG: choice-of-anchor D domain-containing protein [Ignavibacteria bacterium]|nr:choice-of-anchor D domain-containing protein [Ignavibacteria bacterium]
MLFSFMFRFTCALVAAYILASLSLPAQTLSVFDVDASSFPTMKARFFAFGADGKPIQNAISPQDIVLRENGVSRTVTGVTCPPPTGLQPISAVLTLDISGSMAGGRGKYSNLQLAQQASSAFVRALALPPSEAAVSSFDHESYINQDFTAQRDALLNAIAAFQAGGGTSYMNGLLTEPTGSIPIARNGRNKRVVVFLTDGLSDGDENAVVSAAVQNKVEIYCVAVGLPAPPFIKNIARRTGGVCFENVNDFIRITQVYQAIVQLAQGRTPCEFTWRGEAVCDTRTGSITARLSTSPDSLAVSADYDVPQQAVARLSVTPFSVRFYGVPPGSVRDTVITIRAENAPFTVTNILTTSTNAAFTVTPTNFTLQAGESRQLTLRFQPRDSSLTFARFEVKTNSCSALLYAAGGFPPVPVVQPTLRITSPNGGETFLAGADTVITWEGVLPTDTVRLQYSIDSGRTWRTITDSATGLRYAWRYVPNTPSEKCLMRVMSNTINIDVINLKGHKGDIASISFSFDGSKVVTTSRDKTAKIWDVRTGSELVSIIINSSTNPFFEPYWASFHPNGKQIVTSDDSEKGIKLWDIDSKTLLNSIDIRNYNSITNRLGGSRTIFFHNSGNNILVPSDSNAVVLDAISLQTIRTFKSPKGLGSATFSPDYKLVIGAGGTFVKIWNAETGAEIQTLNSPNSSLLTFASIDPQNSKIGIVTYSSNNASVIDIITGSTICSLSLKNFPSLIIGGATIFFNPEGTQVLVATDSRGAFIADAFTGEILKSYYSFPNIQTWISCATYSPDGNKIALAGALQGGFSDSTAKIITLPRYAQVSTSASVWSIVAPQLAVSTNSTTPIDMGAALVGAQKDSVVQAFVVNSTPYPVRVDSIRFEGAQASEFSLVSGVPPFTVAPGASQAVEFRFSPRSAGLRTATIVLVTQSQTVRTAIQGTGIQPSLTQSARLLDFGRVLVGTAKDTTFTAILRNTGAATLTLSAPRLGLPDAVQFSVQSFGAVGASGIASSHTLRPGDSAAITLRFAPTRLGRTSGQVQFRYAAQGASGSFAPLTLGLFGEGIMLPLTARPLVDMGSVVVSAFKDSTVQAFITNPNAQAVSLDAIRFENSQSLAEAQDFSCQTALPLRIPANSTVALTFRFRPSAVGRRTAQMVIGAETQTLTATIQGNGTETPVIRTAALQAPTLTSRVGGTVQIPIYLKNRTGPIPLGTTISATLGYYYALLRPLAPTPVGSVSGSQRLIPLSLTVGSPDENIPLTTLSFRAALAVQQTTPLTFSQLAANPAITLTPQSGEFRLVDAPPATFGAGTSFGTEREEQATARILDISPNPALGGFTVRYETKQAATISILNALGTVAAVFTASADGEWSVSTAGWAAGVYHVRLQAGEVVMVRRVVVMP